MRQPKQAKARRDCRAGFTLVELILTLVLLLLLFGAVVFNYSTLSHGARLDHGVDQLETLFRFARAEAAARGRQVRIVFSSPGLGSAGGTNASTVPAHFSSQNSTNISDGTPPMSTGTNAALAIVWEPDPFGAPGQFVPLLEAYSYVDGILDAVEVLEVRLPAAKRGPTAWGWNGYSAVADKMAHPDDASTALSPSGSSSNSDEISGGPIQMGFFPDGSSDSIEVVIGALDDDDSRKILLSLSGVSGKIHRNTLELDADGRPLEDSRHGDWPETDGTGSIVDLGPSTAAPPRQPNSP